MSKSTHPLLVQAQNWQDTGFNPIELYRKEWEDKASVNDGNTLSITNKPLESFIWGNLLSPQSDCGAKKQTVHHMVHKCPLKAFLDQPPDYQTVTHSAIDYISSLKRIFICDRCLAYNISNNYMIIVIR